MGAISIEIVPRSLAAFEAEAAAVRSAFPQIGILNIPDLIRFDVRSWEAAVVGTRYFPTVIPHLRAIDFNLREPFSLAQRLQAQGIRSVLVITGDKPQDLSRRVYRNSCLELIRIIKKEAPEIKIYAGLDQYRGSFRQELDYVEDKRIAGADGFFTQPFFDERLLAVYLDLLQEYEVFWGISPVMSDAARGYWESKNNSFFPSSFLPTLDWNVDFARRALDLIGSGGGNAYVMPIRINVVDYLSRILAPEAL